MANPIVLMSVFWSVVKLNRPTCISAYMWGWFSYGPKDRVQVIYYCPLVLDCCLDYRSGFSSISFSRVFRNARGDRPSAHNLCRRRFDCSMQLAYALIHSNRLLSRVDSQQSMKCGNCLRRFRVIYLGVFMTQFVLC